MIKTIAHKGLKNYWTKGDESKIRPDMLPRIRFILDLLNDVNFVPKDFEPFRNLRIHPLKGDLKNFWSLDVTGNFRVIFRFENGNAYDLSLEDTH
ncbi:MAG: plasmid maintenance system killer protein [Flavobacterium sp.]|nr:MAG: plasmid maintenance system killer protein [Flavobacterium sp.]